MASPRTSHVASNQTTELVFINSSLARGIGGPAPRVTRRKDDRYTRPCYPPSPTLAGRNVVPLSGRRAARFVQDFVQIEGKILLLVGYFKNGLLTTCLVPELEVAIYQPLDPFNERNLPPSTSVC